MKKIVLKPTVEIMKSLLASDLPAIQEYNPEGFQPCETTFSSIPTSESFRLFDNFKFDNCAVEQYYTEPMIPDSIREKAERNGSLFYGVSLDPFVPKTREQYVWLGGARVLNLFYMFFYMKKQKQVCCVHAGIHGLNRTVAKFVKV